MATEPKKRSITGKLVATRYAGNSSHHLKEPRRNRFPYPLTVGQGDSESPEDI